MHKSGITVSQEVSQAFSQACDEDLLFLKIRISDESFVVAGSGGKTGSVDSNWSSVRDTLSPTEAALFIFNIQADAPATNSIRKWMLMSYVPPRCVVRDKTLYASSRQALKDGLAKSLFVDDYFFSEPDECTRQSYERSVRTEDVSDVLTFSERIKIEEAHAHALRSQPVPMAAMASLPIGVSEQARQALDVIKQAQDTASGAVGLSTFYVFRLHPQNQDLLVEEQKLTTLSELSPFLSQLGQPRYIIFNYSTDAAAKPSTVFVYYCPDDCDRRERMVYASTKRVISDLCSQCSVTLHKKFEVTEPNEVNENALTDEEKSPQNAQAKPSFSKPGRPGRGPARMLPKSN